MTSDISDAHVVSSLREGGYRGTLTLIGNEGQWNTSAAARPTTTS